MAYTELHTAAIRLVHVTRPTDRDLDYLTREFHLVTEDVEAIFGVSDRPSIATRPAYRRLTVLWPTITRRGVTISEVHCFVGYGWLIILDHGNFSAATELTEELQTVPAERLWQDGAMMMLYELWRRAIRQIQTSDRALTPTATLHLAHLRQELGNHLKEFAATDVSVQRDEETIKSFNFLAFTVSHTNPTGARLPVTTSRLPFTAQSYAVASVAVAIVTLLVVSRTL